MITPVLVVGFGSIGKRHVRNLIKLGIIPYVVTRNPQPLQKALFFPDIDSVKKIPITHCIISSATGRHTQDLKKCLVFLPYLQKVLIEKPLDSTYKKARKAIQMAKKKNLKIFVGYNLRFLSFFDIVRKFIKNHIRSIRLIEVVAGQDLRQWRLNRQVGDSYSAQRKLGGGVDLDLSHEIDYILWLFGNDFKRRLLYRTKLSSLKIDSPDIFKLILDYRAFIVGLTLDYIRNPKERYLKIICDNGNSLYCDFIKRKIFINEDMVYRGEGIDSSYIKMLRAFLGIDRNNKHKLCSASEALNVLNILGV